MIVRIFVIRKKYEYRQKSIDIQTIITQFLLKSFIIIHYLSTLDIHQPLFTKIPLP
jgi:hypothetical protein